MLYFRPLEKSIVMARFKKLIDTAFIVVVLIAVSCSDDSDPDQNPNPPPPPPTDDVTVTEVTGGNMFWGEELIITGTGFSTVKAENIVKLTNVFPTQTFCSLNYTSESGGAIEILSVSATQIKIKIPIKLNSSGKAECGPETANVEVTVNGKKGTKEGLQFHGLPWIGNFNYHYNWFDIPNVTRIGDSVMIEGGMGGYLARESDLWDDIKLSIDGELVESKYRTIGLESGWAFNLPVEKYGAMSCSEEPEGWAPAREMKFTLSVAGKTASTELFVQYLPTMSFNCEECPGTEAELNPVDPSWKITGTNIYSTEARFIPQAPCGGPSQGIVLSKGAPFEDDIVFQIPLSLLTDQCTYAVMLADPCGRSELLGFFSK
jgi:hypothetical protein